MERVTKVESLQEIIAEMSETDDKTANGFRQDYKGES
jgi:hypothetical protein